MPAGLCSWFVTGVVRLRLQARHRTKSVEFHDVEIRQRPCRMIMRYLKDPLSACFAWVLPPKQNCFVPSKLRCLSLGRKLRIKITYGD
ncbi:hypothetical protein TNCV_247921 [Trichonephila clavipes]|nr:hypothetical protein TNCV_247921 [Trichonephila clavipes]